MKIEKMQRSFSPRSKALQAILSGEFLKSSLQIQPADQLVVHHVTDSPSLCQIEFEVRHKDGKISFGRHKFLGST